MIQVGEKRTAAVMVPERRVAYDFSLNPQDVIQALAEYIRAKHVHLQDVDIAHSSAELMEDGSAKFSYVTKVITQCEKQK
jgi:hypothetical protein